MLLPIGLTAVTADTNGASILYLAKKIELETSVLICGPITAPRPYIRG